MAAHHPFAELIDLQVAEVRPGASKMLLEAGERHLNPHQVVHGAVLYAMADTGMGAALYPTLAEGEICATIEIKISYFKPVRMGPVACETTLVNRGKMVAHLESRLTQHGVLVAAANGHYAIFKAPGVTPRPPQPGAPEGG